MRLIRCHIENFGILSNVDCEFTDGLNVIYKENGGGKSTLAAFIKSMFYGLPKTGARNVVSNERKRYNPWQGGKYGGFLEFEYQDVIYRVTRYFGNTAAKDQIEIVDMTNRAIDTPFIENLGEEIFGLDEDSFARSTFMNQSSLENTGATTSIRTKLTNLVDNTNDMNNYDTASKALRDYRTSIKPLRGNGGVIGKLIEEQNEIDARKYAAEGKKTRLSEATSRLDNLNERKLVKEAELKTVRERLHGIADTKVLLLKAKQFNDIRHDVNKAKISLKELDGRYAYGLPTEDEILRCSKASDEIIMSNLRIGKLGLTSEEEAIFMDLKQKASSNDIEKTNSRAPLILWILGAIVAAGGIGAFALKSSLIAIIMLLVGLMCVLMGFYLHTKNMINDRNAQIEKRIDDERLAKILERKSSIESERNNLNDIISHNFEYINVILIKYGLEASIDNPRDAVNLLSKICNDYYRQHSVYEVILSDAEAKLHSFKDENSDSLGSIIEIANDNYLNKLNKYIDDSEKFEALENSLSNELNSIDKDITSCRQDREYLRLDVEKIPEYEDQLIRIQEELDEATRKYEIADKTMEFLNQAKDNLASSYVSDVEKGFLHYADILLSDKIGEAMVDKELNLYIDEKGARREVGSFSSGMIDSIMLCMRLGLVDALFTGERPFLVMDDPFVNLDDEHVKKALQIVELIAQNYQVIYFVCSKSRQ